MIYFNKYNLYYWNNVINILNIIIFSVIIDYIIIYY